MPILLYLQVEKPTLVAPEFAQTIKSTEVNEGDEAKFVTKVTGQPEPTVAWFHDDKPIISNDIYNSKIGIINNDFPLPTNQKLTLLKHISCNFNYYKNDIIDWVIKIYH
jgi:hypothetical protein